MIDWKWETFIEVLSEGRFRIDNPGPLHSPIDNFKMYRDDTLQICLETVCRATATSNAPEHPPGTVRHNNDFIEIVNDLGAPSRARANGVQPLKRVIRHENILTEQSTVSEILLTISECHEGCHLIEWIANVDDGYYLWPDMNESRMTEASEQMLRSDDLTIKATSNKKAESFSRDCIFLIVNGWKLFLGKVEDVGINSSFGPGYILYNSVPTEEERKKIRLSLSFAFGRPLLYMGNSIFSEDWRLISSRAVTPYTIDGKVFKLPTSPPAPLSQRSRNELGHQEISDLANAVYRCFDIYGFEHISWLYWHAVAAPTHMAALSFGATFEAIQKGYIRNKGDIFKTRLLEKREWSGINDKITAVLAESMAENREPGFKRSVEIMIGRINNLNEAPRSELAKKFLDSLNINLSRKEHDAWVQRHKAAHGSKTEADDYIRLIKDTKILRVLCNRVLLAITGGSNRYIDYYTTNFPVRNLQDAVE